MSNKKTPIKFKTNQAKCLMKSIALCEGRMTKHDMELLGSKKFTSELIRGNYVSRNKDGSYSSTDKLLKEYRNAFHPAKGFSYSSSISTIHSKGEAKVISFINKETLLKVKIQTAKELSEEHKQYKKTEEYHNVLEDYRQEIRQELQDLEGKADPFSYLEGARLKGILEVAASSQPTSPPDFTLHNFPVTDIDKMIAKMQYSLGHEDYSICEDYYINSAIEQLQEIKEDAYSQGMGEVSLSFEIITSSYSREAILQKTIHSIVTKSNTIFIYQGGGG